MSHLKKNQSRTASKYPIAIAAFSLFAHSALVPVSQAAAIVPVPSVPNHAISLPLLRIQAAIDLRPASELSDEELVQRIEQLKVLPQEEADAAGIDIKSMIKADRQERKARTAATEQMNSEQPAAEEQPAATDQAVVEQPVSEETVEEQVVVEQPATEQKVEEQAVVEETPAKEQASSETAPAAVEQPVEQSQIVLDPRPAGELTDEELVQRIELLKTVSPEAAAAAGIDARAIIKADRAERKARAEMKAEVPAAVEQPAATEQPAVVVETTPVEPEQSQEVIIVPEAEQKAEEELAVQEAKEPVVVSEEAEKPKEVVEESVAAQVEKAEEVPAAVVADDLSATQKNELKAAEKKRRQKAKENRNELLGALATGAVIGALIPALGGVVAADEGDRLVVEQNGRYVVRKDESALFRDDGSQIVIEPLRRGMTLETVTRPDGVQILTVRDAGGYVLRRTRIGRNGKEVVLFDTRDDEIGRPQRRVELPPIQLGIPRESYIVSARRADRQLFVDTFEAEPIYQAPERFSLRQIRENSQVRSLVRRVDLDTVNFDSGSATVTQSQVRLLGDIAGSILDVIDGNSATVFLVEGHTDAVGDELYNLTLSDRRAETVARILVEAYDVPPENLVTQGYGEEFLKVNTLLDERANRRATIRNITPILQSNLQ